MYTGERLMRVAVLIILFWSMPATGQDRVWTDVVRETPYWMSQGVYQNIITIRRWVLAGSGFCGAPDRHILYDRRGRFLGYITDGGDRDETQQRLNRVRAEWAGSGHSDQWVAGGPNAPGYPFALSCDQPHVDLAASIRRYLGKDPDDGIWGTWDDLVIGSETKRVSLHEALRHIYAVRIAQQRLDLPDELPLYLAGKLLIESGAQSRAHSRADARGIMQLSPGVLDDCGIAAHNHWHRMAQIDCALRLLNQNARLLRPAFEARFDGLTEHKRKRLFTLLLVQAYHGGAARVRLLLEDEQLARPAAYFASHHTAYSAGDIAFGMIFHNLGRNRLGLASLYYIADVEIAVAALCRQAAFATETACQNIMTESRDTPVMDSIR
ncbi:MAG: hypothetical protein R6W74_08660 [Nitrosomonas halophila]